MRATSDPCVQFKQVDNLEELTVTGVVCHHCWASGGSAVSATTMTSVRPAT